MNFRIETGSQDRTDFDGWLSLPVSETIRKTTSETAPAPCLILYSSVLAPVSPSTGLTADSTSVTSGLRSFLSKPAEIPVTVRHAPVYGDCSVRIRIARIRDAERSMADAFDRASVVRVLVAPMAVSPVAGLGDGTKSDGMSFSSPVIMWLNAALDDSVCEAIVTMISLTPGFYSKATAADAPPPVN